MSVLDLLPPIAAPQAEEANDWIASALADARVLHRHDLRLLPASRQPQPMREAWRTYAAWSRWVEQAAAVVRRFDGPAAPESLRDLKRELAVGRSLVKETPEQFLDQLEAHRRGELPVTSGEELRRDVELRTRR